MNNAVVARDMGMRGGGALPSAGMPRLKNTAPALLTRRQKAAVILRLLHDQGAPVALGDVNAAGSAALVQAMAGLDFVDNATVLGVIDEFLADLSRGGISFEGGIDAAVDVLKEQIHEDTHSYLPTVVEAVEAVDPWNVISAMDPVELSEILQSQSVQVGVVVMSKVKAGVAAAALAELPSERAREVLLGVARAEEISVESIALIGEALVAGQQVVGESAALGGDPVARAGEILNMSTGAAREDILAGFQSVDGRLASSVRRVMFTFADIPDRVGAGDISKIVRVVEGAVLVTALIGAASEAPEVPEFILGNLSKRLAEQIRDEVAEAGDVPLKDAEAAMATVIQSIRDLEAAGEIVLIAKEEEAAD